MANKVEVYSNKTAIMNVLAGLMRNPLLFANNEYRFDVADFPERFHQILFGAIEHLALKGMRTISYLDVDQFLQQYKTQYEIFCQNDGVNYINQILEIADDKNFKYYYETLKKISLLNSLREQGFDITDIYDADLEDPTKSAEMQQRFDSMSVNDIIHKEEVKILRAKAKYGTSSDVVAGHAGDDGLELKEQYKKTPEIGAPMCSAKLSFIYRGQRIGCLFLESAPQGAGKSRRAASEACNIAIPEFYDTEKKCWVKTGMHEKTLLISTELEQNECETMFWAYISGVREDHILDGNYAPGEEERVDHAIKLLQNSNLFFVSITNFDTDDLVNVIKEYNQLHGVRYVYFDYLSETVKLLSEGAKKTKISGLRTDQILLQMSTELKDTAKQYGVFIWTASQLSGNYKSATEVDNSYLRSAKSLSDKVDVGSIMLPVRECDQKIIESYVSKGFERTPNFVISVYKVRRGSYQNIKVYVYFDRSTCRMYDCFVTDADGHLLPVQDAKMDVTVLDKTSVEDFENSGFVVDY